MSRERASKKGGLPANVTAMAAALQKSASAAGGSGSDKYMKMDRQGVFSFGAENLEPEEGSTWAANPMGLTHGWTAWGNKAHDTEGKNVGEMMVPATQPYPLEEDLPEVKGEWTKATALQLRCTNGEDEGIQVQFKTNSVGGRKAFSTLLQEMVNRMVAGETDVVPLLKLESDFYKHATYGKIFFPVFTITKWVSMDGEPTTEDEEEAPAEDAPEDLPTAAEQPDETPAAEEEAPRRRRRTAS